jgi:hypothetical protein
MQPRFARKVEMPIFVIFQNVVQEAETYAVCEPRARQEKRDNEIVTFSASWQRCLHDTGNTAR